MTHRPPIRAGLAALTGLLMAACAPDATTPKPSTSQANPPATPPAGDAQAPRNTRPGERVKVGSIGFERFFTLHSEGKLLVIDSRPAYYYQLGHIPGALNLPKDSTPQDLDALEGRIRQAIADGKTVVVYCSGILCADARTVARRITGRGHPASTFSGGWDAWQEAGLPSG
jgi:rhodanese-related sulfurtransferase